MATHDRRLLGAAAAATAALAVILGAWTILTSTSLAMYLAFFVFGVVWTLTVLGVGGFLLAKLLASDVEPQLCAASLSSSRTRLASPSPRLASLRLCV